MIVKMAAFGALHQLAGMAPGCTAVPAMLSAVNAGQGSLGGREPARAALLSSNISVRCGMDPGATQAGGKSGPDRRLPCSDSPSSDCE